DRTVSNPPLVLFDDNVFYPISKKGQEHIYDQLSDLLCSLSPIFENGFDPCFSIEGFLERIGEGTLWEKVDIYNGISISLSAFSDREKLADEIGKVSKEILKSMYSNEFFSKENLNKIYQKSSNFVGNEKSSGLLNNTFHRVGKLICNPLEDHLKLIGWDLLWDRLVAFPVLWTHPDEIENVIAYETWLQAEKYYDVLFAMYHNQKFIDSDAPFTRLILHRRFIDLILRLKHLKQVHKKLWAIGRLLNLYQIYRLTAWVKQHKWAFKPNSDLLDVKIMHFATYGASVGIEKGVSKRRPVICITCDSVEVIEQRLALCHGSAKDLCQQVKGWHLPLCPGIIICLDYGVDRKFSHVKTINVQQFFEERNKLKTKTNNLKFKVNLFAKVFREWIGDLIRLEKIHKNKKRDNGERLL
ncbi:MAG: hypothetical protein KBA81_04495, partial [Rhabdochlamydiaceae bacterium]|nr:hypothetical protein [Rhabdochlamydiaceae bacterium]